MMLHAAASWVTQQPPRTGAVRAIFDTADQPGCSLGDRTCYDLQVPDSSTRALLKTLASLTTGGFVLGGLVGAVAVALVGPFLAMGLVIWSGQGTEPAQSSLSYPWGLTMLGALGWGVGIWGEHRAGGGHPYTVLSWCGSIAIALLPMVQLWRLWGESTP